jgi:hypothetical protein
MNELLTNLVTWEILATYAGAAAMMLVIVQITKGLPGIVKLPTQLWSYIVALLILYPATYFTAGLTASSALLILFNAAIVSLASNGAFDALKKMIGGKKNG